MSTKPRITAISRGVRLSAVAQVGVGAGAQQALHHPQQAVQRGQVQRAEAARVLRVERDVFVEQAFEAGQQHVLVAGGAGFGARAEQQQQRRGAARPRSIGFGAGQQQRVEQRDQARAFARGEAVQRGAMQRRCRPCASLACTSAPAVSRRAAMSGRPSAAASISTVTSPGRRCSSGAPAASRRSTISTLAHAHRRRQRRRAGMRGAVADRRRARAAGRPPRDGRHRPRAAARCSPGCRSHRPAGRGRAGGAPHRRRRRSPPRAGPAACSGRPGSGQPRQSSQSARSRRPDDSATPSGVWPSAARMSGAAPCATSAFSAASRPSAAARCSALMPWLSRASRSTPCASRRSTRRDQPRRTASASGGSPRGRGREGIGAAFEQVERELLERRAPACSLADAGGQEARQPAGARRRHAAAQQRLQRRQRGRAAREQREQRGVAVAVAHIGVGALRQQPVDALGAGARRRRRAAARRVRAA